MQEELEEEEELCQALFSFQLLIICVVSPSYLRSGIQQSLSPLTTVFKKAFGVFTATLPVCTGRQGRVETSSSGSLCLLLRVGGWEGYKDSIEKLPLYQHQHRGI